MKEVLRSQGSVETSAHYLVFKTVDTMTTKNILTIILLIAVLVLGGVYVKQQKDATGPNTSVVPSLSYVNADEDDIVVASVEAVSPTMLHVEGEARGPWYFEASFPIEVLDVNSMVIGTGFATADGDWMTTDFVPFTADITLSAPYTGAAVMILKKDNPSGEPANDASLLYGFAI